MPKPPQNLMNKTYGLLTVIAPAPRTRQGHIAWQCQCECGTTKIVTANNLRSGNTLSCGCLRGQARRELAKQEKLKALDDEPIRVWMLTHTEKQKYRQLPVTQDELKALFDYDAEHGWLIHKTNRPGTTNGSKGKKAGSSQSNGYEMMMINRRRYYMHQLVWLWHYNEVPHKLDHINGDRADNRVENLRPATDSQNGWNRKVHTNNSSGYTGVTKVKDRNKWVANVTHHGETFYLGRFDSPEEAAKAYDSFIEQTRGSYARLNNERV